MDLSALPARLGHLVLERLPSGTFIRRGPAPAWSFSLRTPVPGAEVPFASEDVFPFLSVFLPEAEAAWQGDLASRVDSDFWTEISVDGGELHLEASALRLGSAELLIITRSDRLFQQQQLLLQRARELRLIHQSLVREIEEKDILVHTIVHDLGAPLHSILGTLTLLSELPLDGPAPEWIQIALRAATRQRHWIDQILDVFVASQGAPARATGPLLQLDVAAMIEQVIAELAPLAQQRLVRLEAAVFGAPCWVEADEARLFRVLMNLVENAIRSAPASSPITITARRQAGVVEVEVEDDGPGVAPEVGPKLFEAFAHSRESAGTGLGLYFCRITIERWGGQIGYVPRRPRGSRFWFSLPAAERSLGEV